jgi:hypothetical protein
MNTKLTMPNGEILEVNFFDLDFREHHRKLNQKYVDDLNALSLPEEGDQDGEMRVLREQADLSRNFFDQVWGEGTSDRIFGTGVRDLYLIFSTIKNITQMKLDQDDAYKALGVASAKLITDRLGK